MESIGRLMGTVRKVDTSRSRDCIGKFLRVKIRFNVREPLMRGTFVNFPDDGKVWVDFKYESLLKYCIICGMLRHATRVCKGLQVNGMRAGKNSGDLENTFAFRGLDVETDLQGNPLGISSQSKASAGLNGGQKSSER